MDEHGIDTRAGTWYTMTKRRHCRPLQEELPDGDDTEVYSIKDGATEVDN